MLEFKNSEKAGHPEVDLTESDSTTGTDVEKSVKRSTIDTYFSSPLSETILK